MAQKQPKPKKKPMTLDAFAVLVQKDLARMATKNDIQMIREEMVTKEDVATIRTEMATRKDLERFATKDELTTAFDTLADRVAIAKEELREEIAGLKYAREIDELRSRVNVLERKVGIKSANRAA